MEVDPVLPTQLAASPDWQAVATILYAELSRWGYGDFHYGETPRDPEVLAALAVYDQALKNAQESGKS